jgi:hypothetical protein
VASLRVSPMGALPWGWLPYGGHGYGGLRVSPMGPLQGPVCNDLNEV